ncbi:hypothetical protein PL81_20885 [Streptomyces sp. RSD-27]|nr:hypothetical protein PL81_20885 [Streptomyces sp. RSD-27]
MLRATGLATDRTADRITLSLALQIHALHGPATDPAPHPTPALAHLLAQPPVTDWAATALAPLGQERTDQRTTSSDTLARTLRTWAHEDFRVETTAQRLNLYPATVRGHIRTAEALLGWMLLSHLPTGLLPDGKDAPGKQSGLRNLAVALQAGPGTPRTTLPDPTERSRSFHAVSTGPVNAPCPSDTSAPAPSGDDRTTRSLANRPLRT